MFQLSPAVQELQQSARPLGELEAVDHLVRQPGHTAADHIADVELRHFVVAHVQYGVILRRATAVRLVLFAVTTGQMHAYEDVRFTCLRVAVVELRDRCAFPEPG